MHSFTAGSLFSGVGMFDYAFAVAGFDILFQVEIDAYCQKVLKKHAPTYWPHSEVHADVCGVGRHNLPSVDVLFGGFPCQDISVSGHRNGIQEGTRSGLWYEFKRLIGELRPHAVVLENVAAILRSEGIKVISDLTQMGYDCKWGVISAKDVGAPHLRERWWCIALSNAAHKGADRRNGQQGNHAESCRDGLAHRGIRGYDGDELVNASGVRLVNLERRSRNDSNVYGHSQTQNKRWAKKPFGDLVSNGQMEHTEGDGFARVRSPIRQSRVSCDREIFALRESVALGDETQSRMGGISDGTAARMDGSGLMSHVFPVGPNLPQPSHEAPRMATGNKNTNARLKALGNGGMPQIVYPIALELKALLEGGL